MVSEVVFVVVVALVVVMVKVVILVVARFVLLFSCQATQIPEKDAQRSGTLVETK